MSADNENANNENQPEHLLSNSEQTRVDLGEDLVEKTVAFPGIERKDLPPNEISRTPSFESEETIQEKLHSAKILVGEGLIEDAKRILHEVLIKEGGNILGRQLLLEIHETELKQILGSEQDHNPYHQKKKFTSPLLNVDAEEVMRSLDRDLGLGIFSNDGSSKPSPLNALSLFENGEGMRDFAEKLDQDFASSSFQDRMDLGVAFLEMDLYELAARQFDAAIRGLVFGSQSEVDQDGLILSATCLLAFSLILAGHPFEATTQLIPMIRDPEIKKEQKTELFYLMGRAYEALKKPELANQYYQHVRELDSFYRDVEERAKKISGQASRKRAPN